jgi:two-component system sensor histidine kinase KdpD
VESWLETVAAGFTRKKVAVANEIPPELVVDVDEELLRRCILNLLENAQKYGPRGNTVRIQVGLDPTRWVLKISDQGPGIPAGMEEAIFDPFARLERDVSQARVSSGLGLAFCREVAQAHGGSIWVENGEPAGAVFSLALPRRG